MRFAILLALAAAASGQTQPRGYSIPVLDLSSDTHRQVIVDREAGQYLGHPTTVLLEDGRTILCVYPKGHGKGPIVLRRSRDGGQTWSERLPVPNNWSTSLGTPTIHRTVDAKGKKRLLLFSGLYPIRKAVSEDDGATWTPLKPIGDFGGIVAMSDLVRLRDGRYMAVFHDDGRFIASKPQAREFKKQDGVERWRAHVERTGCNRAACAGTPLRAGDRAVARSPATRDAAA